jgi:hypothetical protein
MKKVIITDKIPFQNVELTVKLKEYAAMVGPAGSTGRFDTS